MHFLVDASLPRAVAILLRAHGHAADDVRDIGLGVLPDEVIAAHARANRLTLISADFDFADVRDYPPSEYAGLVVIDRPERASVQDVLSIVGNLMVQGRVLDSLVGRLAIVDASRVRVRPALPDEETR